MVKWTFLLTWLRTLNIEKASLILIELLGPENWYVIGQVQLKTTLDQYPDLNIPASSWAGRQVVQGLTFKANLHLWASPEYA